MMNNSSKAKNVDEYIERFPPETQKVLQRIRSIVRKIVPEAQEAISYGIPVFNLNGSYLVYFAGYKQHVSVYPAPRGADSFKELLAKYKGGKGTVQFPLNEPLPEKLIEKMIKFLVKQNEKRTR